MPVLHALERFSPRRLRAGRVFSLLALVGVALSACSDASLPTQVDDLEAPESVAFAPAGTPTGLRATRQESVLSPGDASVIRLTDDNGVPVDASEVTWTVGLTAVATVSSSGVVRGVSPGTTVVTARRGQAVTQHHVVVVGGGDSALRLSPRESLLFPGEGEQLEVSDGGGRTVAAADVDWSSSATSVVTVSPSGRITAVAGGAAVITVRRGSGVAQHGVIVVGEGSTEAPPETPESPAGLRVSPRESVLGRGDVSAPRVTDGSGNPVDESAVEWISGLPTVATVSSAGLVRGVSPGVAVIVAHSGSEVAFHQAVVVGGGAAAIRLSSGESALAPGQSEELTVFDANGDPVPSSQVTWSSSSTSVATVSSSGVIRAVAAGAAVITARRGDGVAQHGVLVGGGSAPPPSRSLRKVRGDGQSAAPGSQLPTRPTVRVVDGSGNGVAGVSVRWSVLAGGGSVSSTSTTTNSAGETSVAWSLGSTAGSQTLEARADGAGSARFDATATSETQTGIRVTRKESVLSPGDVSLVHVVDDAGQPVDASKISWSSSAPGVATVSSTGLVRGISGGNATVTARLGTASAQHSVVVVGGSSGPEVDRIDVSPGSSSLEVGESAQIQATARDASGNPVSVTFTWSSDRADLASVSSSGRVTANSPGTTTIRVSAGGKTASHQVTVEQSSAVPSPPSGGWNEPGDFVTTVDEHWNSFDDLGWYHNSGLTGNVETRNGKLVWTYPAGMEGGRTPGSPVVLEYRHGPYEYQRDEGVTLSPNFHGHQSGVNKFRYWSDVRPKSPLGFFGAGDAPLTLGINTGDWPMGVRKLRWDSPDNYANPTRQDAEVVRGVPNDIESLIYLGTAGNADGWLKVWLNGVLVLDFRNLAIVWPGERTQLSQIHLAPVWGGMGDVVPVTQWLSVDRTYVSVRP